MHVIKRNGEREGVSFDKITARLAALCEDLVPAVDPVLVAKKVVAGVVDGMTTSQIDTLSAETAAYMSTTHYEYGVLAGRISVSNLQKQTLPSFSQTMELLQAKTGVLSDERFARFMRVVRARGAEIDARVRHERDFVYDYFAIQTLIRGYLFRVDDVVVERPQHMWMRVAVGIHGDDLDAALETYDMLSLRKVTHATPTLFNAGTNRPQMSSCFLLQMREDSVDGIFDTLKQCARISKSAGGIGLAAHKVRAVNSKIKGSNGKSSGLVPMLRVFDSAARYVDQGSKRKGSIAIYLEPWHADVEDFLRMKRNQGKEEMKARDLFYGLWIPDLFMRRVESDGDWTLFSPDEAPGLHEVWGEEFDALYETYEREKLGRKTLKAQDLWKQISVAQIETGTPYLLFKDACNRKSNQRNLGTIQCSNLCTEIVQYTSETEVAVCNLASISLPSFLNEEGADGEYDFLALANAARALTRNLNKIIDGNFYPVPEARNSNLQHRPIGVGVQGLADVFAAKGLAFDSTEARALDRKIFETIYFGCLDASCDLAQQFGAYPSYAGSPFSKGELQMDAWGPLPEEDAGPTWDWAALRERIKLHGTRNSLLTTVMPTASTSQILGNNECVEPFTNNVYARKTLAGDFFVVNKWLVRDLHARGLWTTEMQDAVIANKGSVQHIAQVPDDLKLIYRTVWEIPQRSIVQMAAARGPFIDQSQSLNIHMRDASYEKFNALHHTAWRLGLKGTYYLRTQTMAQPIAFTVPIDKKEVPGGVRLRTVAEGAAKRAPPPPPPAEKEEEEEEEGCVMCSS